MIAVPNKIRFHQEMKSPLILLVALTSSVLAQPDTSKLLEQGLRKAALGVTPVSAEEQSILLQATATLLAKHVTFRPDGSASSFFDFSIRQQVEWKNLVVKNISQQPVNEADRLNGITRRYFVAFSSDAHRTWDTKANTWQKWYPIGNPFFPAGFMFVWKNKQWTAEQTDQLKHFSPGPGPSIAAPRSTTESQNLPPGMTRGK